MSLVSRILAIGVVGLVVFSLLAIYGVERATDTVAERNVEAYLSGYADIFVPAIRIEQGVATIDSESPMAAQIPRDWQISQNGKPQRRSKDLIGWMPLHSTAGSSEQFRFSDADGREIVALQKDYVFPGQVVVTVSFGLDAILVDRYLDQQRSALREKLRPFFYGFVVVGAIVLLCLVAVVVWPLRRLRADISALDQGHRDRLGDRYPAELNVMSRMLNQQFHRHDASLKRYRQFASNLSHAIKTPLTSLRLQTTSNEVREDLDAIDAIVERNLARVRIAGPKSGAASRIHVEPLMQALARSYRKISGVVIDVNTTGELTFDGDAEDLVEAVGNVLENACRYAERAVKLSASSGKIVVEDDGPGLSDAQCDSVIERGTRLDQADNGSGIGLSIANEIVQSYNGQIELRNRADGGLAVTISLPSIRGA